LDFAIPTVIAPFLQASDFPPLALDPLLEPLEVFAELLVLELLLLLPQALNATGAATRERSATSLVWVPVNRRNLSPFTMRACARFACIENVTDDQVGVKQFRGAEMWS
jgi:hypothetical protein